MRWVIGENYEDEILDTEHSIVIIFERKKLHEDDKQIIYGCVPYTIMEGVEIFTSDDTSCFIGKKKKPKINPNSFSVRIYGINPSDRKYIYDALDDKFDINSTFVYAFPTSADFIDEYDEDITINEFNKILKSFKKNFLYQVYNRCHS